MLVNQKMGVMGPPVCPNNGGQCCYFIIAFELLVTEKAIHKIKMYNLIECKNVKIIHKQILRIIKQTLTMNCSSLCHSHMSCQ